MIHYVLKMILYIETYIVSVLCLYKSIKLVKSDACDSDKAKGYEMYLVMSRLNDCIITFSVAYFENMVMNKSIIEKVFVSKNESLITNISMFVFFFFLIFAIFEWLYFKKYINPEYKISFNVPNSGNLVMMIAFSKFAASLVLLGYLG